MSTYEVRFHLKKPLMVYALAICFILAPLINILASMIGFGIYHWYTPATFVAFLHHISWIDRSWLLLTFFAGICLLKQRKWAWLLAIGALAIASAFNFHYGMKYSSRLAHAGHFFPILFMLSNLAVIIVLYHFRFPYIDRREAWWGVQPRYRCSFPCSATGADGSRAQGTLTNLSVTGAFLEGGSQLQEGAVVTLQIASLDGLKAEVVRATDHGCGMQFEASPLQKKQIKELIANLSERPIGDPALSIKL